MKPHAIAPARLLVVDDDPPLARSLVRRLGSEFDAESAPDAEQALARLDQKLFQLVLMDVNMPGMGGLEALARMKASRPELEIVIMTGQASVDMAVEAMRGGAFDLLQKPFQTLDHVELVLRRALEHSRLRVQNAALRSRLDGSVEMIGTSTAMRAVMSLLPDLAHSEAPVLIEGESGTGKDVLARAIHAGGARAAKPLVAVNCGAIPEAMLESELFGHEKGAFTGAVSATRGLFRSAEGGTLFLDEVGDLPAQMQVKILRALQEREVRSIGSTLTEKIDIRVIAATNHNLVEGIAAGTFRQDLYYRLAVVPVRLAPLRERREDIPALVRHFVRLFNAEEHKFDGVDPRALDALCAWDWPGNIRELENAVARAFALGKPGQLTVGHLPPEIVGGPLSTVSAEGRALDSLPLRLEAYEKYALERALREAEGDAEGASRLLDLPRSTFYRYLKSHGLKPQKR